MKTSKSDKQSDLRKAPKEKNELQERIDWSLLKIDSHGTKKILQSDIWKNHILIVGQSLEKTNLNK